MMFSIVHLSSYVYIKFQGDIANSIQLSHILASVADAIRMWDFFLNCHNSAIKFRHCAAHIFDNIARRNKNSTVLDSSYEVTSYECRDLFISE